MLVKYTALFTVLRGVESSPINSAITHVISRYFDLLFVSSHETVGAD